MDKKQLTIAFITYNRKCELKRAIESCINAGDCSAEYIIIDNNSSDGTEEYLKNLINTKHILYYNTGVNLGVAGGRNVAFEKSTGEYVFFLDDDAVISTPDFFKKMISFMDENKNVVAMSPNIQEPASGSNLNCSYYRIAEYHEILSYCGCAHVIRKGFYGRFKSLYPNNLKFGSEELYASLLAHMNEYLVVQDDDLLVEHFPSVINRVQGQERKLNFIFNQYIIKKMTYPKSKLVLSNFCFRLHLKKNGFGFFKINKEISKLMSERYSETYVNRMSNKIWRKIVKKFGWRATL